MIFFPYQAMKKRDSGHQPGTDIDLLVHHVKDLSRRNIVVSFSREIKLEDYRRFVYSIFH